MMIVKNLPEFLFRALPGTHFGFDTETGTLVMYIELPKNQSDPYLNVRYEFRPRIPELGKEQRN